jgi:CBS domain-containing protein
MLVEIFPTSEGPMQIAELGKSIADSQSAEEVALRADQLPHLFAELVDRGGSAAAIGRAVGELTDAITRRILTIAETDLGKAPVPYAWTACGSQARFEQTLRSDQDSVLILSDEYRPEHQAYFGALATLTTRALERCGFPRCPGDVMASNPQLRLTLQGWREEFAAWVRRPDFHAMVRLSFFLDMRVVAGDTTLLETLQADIRRRLESSGVLPTHMLATALRNAPPLGFFGGLKPTKRNDQPGLDVKHGGLMPIVDLARVYAVIAHAPSVGTLERLHEAREAGILGTETGTALEQAWNVLGGVRARHQASALAAGRDLDSFVPLAEIDPIRRQELKRSFKAIRRTQQMMGEIHRVGAVV